MKITDIFKQNERTFSFEFFPPKDEIAAVDFGINIGRLMKLAPAFVSVTYGAGGSTRERTFELTKYLINRIGITVMAHYTCVDASKEKVASDLEYLQSVKVENLMLLRGDPPAGGGVFKAHPEGFAHASELVEFVSARFGKSFAVGAGCYPEGHPEAESIDQDVQNLKAKVDAGADFLVTQLFFDNKRYFDFVARARSAGIHCRIIPGVIPITSYSQIERFTRMSATVIPPSLAAALEAAKFDSEALYRTGVEYASFQCRELLAGGAPGIHFYTLNKSRAAVDIFEQLL
jgi:methylenetetrahydrofolate reductase (NADPH)